MFEAAKVVFLARLVLHSSTPAASQSLLPPTPLTTFFAPSALERVSAIASMRQQLVSREGCASAAFLLQTVIDDARLVTLDGAAAPVEAARTLACWGLLAGLGRGGLLRRFLGSADLLLEEAAGGVGAGSRSQHDYSASTESKFEGWFLLLLLLLLLLSLLLVLF